MERAIWMPADAGASDRRFRRAMFAQARHRPRSFPWRDSRDPYAVLIGEVLLQRTRGEQVAAVFERFLEQWPTPAALAAATEGEIARSIEPLGLIKRAPILSRLGEALVELGRVPRSPEELEGLPGVGRYGAHAVPVFAHHRNLPLVDWVIARVLRRYFDLPSGRRPNHDATLWEKAARLAATGRARELWLGVLDFAAAICRPQPQCEDCPLARSCAYSGSRDSGGA